jgi:hypothetical protein
MTTPGILDPESFETPEEFLSVMLADGITQGWKPVFPLKEELTQADISRGMAFVEQLKEGGDF